MEEGAAGGGDLAAMQDQVQPLSQLVAILQQQQQRQAPATATANAAAAATTAATPPSPNAW